MKKSYKNCMQTYKIGVKQLLKRCNKNYTYLTFEIGVPTGLKTKKKKKNCNKNF
jgi:hypothetical protein